MEIEDDHDHILDVGCHTGHYIQALRERGYKGSYFGVDITPEFIWRARTLLPNEYFGVGDCRVMPFLSGSFNMVMCVGVLMHLPEIQTTMKKIFRVADKYVLISTYGSKRHTYEDHQGGFLNTYYAKSDILAEQPIDWDLVKYKEFKRTDIQKNNWIFQFLFRRVS
jgi:ubiquinone/menaquinone biosynthesis C-methylase UbiE